MDIVDLKKSTQDNVHKVFEGRVVSAGSSSQFAMVADCLIDALFENFPGVSGKTSRVTLYSKSCGHYERKPAKKAKNVSAIQKDTATGQQEETEYSRDPQNKEEGIFDKIKNIFD